MIRRIVWRMIPGFLRGLARIEVLPDPRATALLLRELTHLARGTLPLAKGLAASIEDARQPHIRHAMTLVAERLQAGEALSTALACKRGLVPDYVIALAEMGERSGRLGDMLAAATEMLEGAVTFKRRLAAVLAYPAALIAISTSIVAGVMIFIVPKFEAMFVEMEIELPATTVLLCDVSHVLARFWYLLPLAATVLAMLVSRWHWLRYRLPLFGPMLRDAASCVLATILAPMLRAGLDAMTALYFAKGAIRHRALAEEVERMADRLSQGQTLAEAAQRCQALPAAFRWLIANGEASGELLPAFDQARDLYTDKCGLHENHIEAIVQPASTLLVASAVAFIAVSFMAPLAKLMGSLG